MIRCTRWHVLTITAVVALYGLVSASNAFAAPTQPTPSVRNRPALRAFHATIVPMRAQVNECAAQLGRDPYPVSKQPVLGVKYRSWVRQLWWKRKASTCGTLRTLSQPEKAICYVFGSRCSEALRVARCESRFSTYAQNGQYLGLFQMGSWERRTYGHGYTPLEQARAAYRYFLVAGWRPWECARIVGVA